MRYLLVFAIACGGGQRKPAGARKPVPVANEACAPAYAEYEKRWRTARSEELVEAEFDAAAIEDVISIEVALLPKRTDLEKLRGQYVAVAVFLPDAPWPRALDAAGTAIDACGEEAPRP